MTQGTRIGTSVAQHTAINPTMTIGEFTPNTTTTTTTDEDKVCALSVSFCVFTDYVCQSVAMGEPAPQETGNTTVRDEDISIPQVRTFLFPFAVQIHPADTI